MAEKKIVLDVVVDSQKSIQTLGQLQKELADLTLQLEGAEKGSESFNKLTKRINETKEALQETEGAFGEARDTLKTLSGGPVERVTASFGLLKEGILGLDFGKFKTGLKGVTAAFGGLGKAIIATGIGALVILVVKLIQNFDSLSKAGGLVGEIFGAIGDVVSTLKDGLIALTNSWGLTAIANDEATESLKKYKEEAADLNSTIEQEIINQRLLDGEITEFEAKRLKAIEDRNIAEREALRVKDEAIKAAEEAADETTSIAIDAALDVFEKTKQLIEIRYDNEVKAALKAEQAKTDAASKAEEDRIKKIAETRKAAEQKALDAFLKNIKTIDEVENKAFKDSLDETDRILAEANEKRIEIQKNFFALSGKEQEKQKKAFDNAIIQLDDETKRKLAENEKKLADKLSETRKKNLDEFIKITQDFDADANTLFKESLDKESKILAEANEKRTTLQLAFDKLSNEEKIKQKKAFDNAIIQIDAETNKELADSKKETDDKIIKQEQEKIQSLIDALRFYGEASIDIFSNITDSIASTRQTDLNIEATQLEAQFARRRQYIEENVRDETQRANQLRNLDGEIARSRDALERRQLELDKQAIKRERNITIATIALNTAISIAEVVKNSAKNSADPISLVATILLGIGAVVTAMVKANNALKSADASIAAVGAGGGGGGAQLPNAGGIGGGGGGSGGGTPFAPNQFALFGTAGSSNNLGQDQGQFIQAFVVESDITGVQRRINRFRTASEI